MEIVTLKEKIILTKKEVETILLTFDIIKNIYNDSETIAEEHANDLINDFYTLFQYLNTSKYEIGYFENDIFKKIL